jgi:hypothetical protein
VRRATVPVLVVPPAKLVKENGNDDGKSDQHRQAHA